MSTDIQSIIGLISQDKLSALGASQNVDKPNQKITGEFILKSLIRCALLGRRMSLRGLETICNRSKSLLGILKVADETKRKVDHSSIGKRLSTINAGFFEAIYEDTVNAYANVFGKNNTDKYDRFDSTIITLSGKLLTDGLKLGGKETDRHIKITVGLKNSIPGSVRFCDKQSDSSEDVALVAAINTAKVDKESVLLFDRGISKGDTFADFTKRDIKFITRVNVNRKYKVIRQHVVNSKEVAEIEESGITISSDEIVQLYNKDIAIPCDLRLVKALNKDKTELWFLTNLVDLTGSEVATAYKQRWDIEVLFKFLKQHLQFKQFISYNVNGMKVYLYCLLTAAILFVAYKMLNKLTGFKIALLQFTLDLEKSIVKDIVYACGGDPGLSKWAL